MSTCALLPRISGCDSNPPWGPFLDNPKAKFYLHQSGDDYFLRYEYLGEEGIYCVRESDEHLYGFVGEKVKVGGHFTVPVKDGDINQCIVGECHKTRIECDNYFGSEQHVIDVDDIWIDRM